MARAWRLTAISVLAGMLAAVPVHAAKDPARAQDAAAVEAARVPTVADARALAAQAESELAAAAGPALQAVARRNVETARALLGAIEAIDADWGELTRLRDRLGDLQRQMRADEDRIRLSGSTAGPVASVLLRHRRDLPAQRTERAALDRTKQRAADAEIARIDVADELAALDRPAAAAATIAGTDPAAIPAVESALRDRARRYLLPLLAADARHSALLSEFESVQSEYVEAVDAYRALIGAHVIWLPNMPPVGAGDARDLAAQAGEYGSGAFWTSVVDGIVASTRQVPLRWLGSGLLVLLLIVLRGRLHRALVASGGLVGQENDRARHTVRGLVATALLAAPVPVAMRLFGGAIQATSAAGSLGPLGDALSGLAGLGYLVTFLHALCLPGGVALVHFRWPAVTVVALRRASVTIGLVVVPLLFVAFTAVRTDEGSGGGALARWAVILALLVMTAVSARLFARESGIVAPLLARAPRGWTAILRPFWYPLLVLMPAALAVAAAAGYVITASVIVWNLPRSYWVLLGIAVALSMATRVGTRPLERLGLGLGGDAEMQADQRAAEQVERITRLLTFVTVLVGLVWAWSDLLPAFGIVRTVTLWTVGATETSPGTAVTLANAVVAVLSVVVTVALVRDLPGVLNIAILRRFPFDSSTRYAIVAVGRYVLVIAGLVATFTSLGIGWANVQWLAAAATVGLGFGLQEIFANFFSGLVVLAERPVRVGDVVTVDGITGRVTKIATRATQILDADNKEVIIPNKQFVTGRIVNWTLDGLPLRHVLTVGVELGSDLGVAERAVMQGVVGADRVLASPAPQVLLRGFAPGVAEFEVWFWVAGAADGAVSRHDAVLRIDRLLREAGIRIASPQMDVRFQAAVGAAAPPVAPRFPGTLHD